MTSSDLIQGLPVGGDRGLDVVRHELKNVLSAASLQLDLLAESNCGSEERIDALRDALSQALGLSDRLGSGITQEPEMSVDLSELVHQCVRLARPEVEEQGTLTESIASRVGRVALSEVEGRELVLNLLLNAARAIEPGGCISVRLSALAQEGRVRLLIADNGVGMSADLVQRALLPGVSSRPGGTGLGLPRVAALVEKLGGGLRIRSRPGKGTLVAVTLPVSPTPGCRRARSGE